jgi:geranylgeranyl diphosphate synthase, type II
MATSALDDLQAALEPVRSAVDSALDQWTRGQAGIPQRLTEAIRYSVLAPGKRLRPVLVLWACEAVCDQWKIALPAACAVEFIHVYSLIHDDLPAMDNDDLRRGQPTCHKKFDEATAILAGDSLQMLAIEALSTGLPEASALKCCQILSRLAGREHLVGGQVDDLSAEGRFGPIPMMETNPLEFLKQIHRRKTSALIEASLQIGGVIGGASEGQRKALSVYGQSIGLAFQIVDDCLDVESTAEHLGKSTRKDSSLGKLTYPGLLGLKDSRDLAVQLIDNACESLSEFGDRASKLRALARFIIDRRN